MKNDYCVIMGGGIGSRFWPFSREKNPKQFLDFFGTGRSLLQQTYDRFAKIIPPENIYIVTNALYAGLMREQLPQLTDRQILLEPCRRNTAPCIAYAAYHIQARNPNANIVVTPSDHLILKEDVFLSDVRRGLDFVKNNNTLLTMGVRPSRPETGYGYIQSSEECVGDFVKVKTFTEKPNKELAQVFMDSGEFFWNSGMFLWNVGTIIKAFHDCMPDLAGRFDLGKDKFNTPEENDFIAANFALCPRESIDYGVMEKSENVYMFCVDFGWADLGTWGSVYELAEQDEEGNASLISKTLFSESKGNLVALKDKSRLTVIHGLEDCVVVEADNVLLICKRDEEQRIKELMADAWMKYGDQFK